MHLIQSIQAFLQDFGVMGELRNFWGTTIIKFYYWKKFGGSWWIIPTQPQPAQMEGKTTAIVCIFTLIAQHPLFWSIPSCACHGLISRGALDGCVLRDIHCSGWWGMSSTLLNHPNWLFSTPIRVLPSCMVKKDCGLGRSGEDWAGGVVGSLLTAPPTDRDMRRQTKQDESELLNRKEDIEEWQFWSISLEFIHAVN